MARGFLSTSAPRTSSSTGVAIPYVPVTASPTPASSTAYAASTVAQTTKSPTPAPIPTPEGALYTSPTIPYVAPEIAYNVFEAAKASILASIPANAVAVAAATPHVSIPGVPYTGITTTTSAIPTPIIQPVIVSAEQGYTGRTVYAPTYQYLKDILKDNTSFYLLDIDNLVLARKNNVPVSQVVSSNLSQGQLGAYNNQKFVDNSLFSMSKWR